MYTFVKALGPIFSSLSRDDPSLCSALACIAEKCDIITAMCVRNARPAVRFCNNLNMYKSQAAADETRFTVLHPHPNIKTAFVYRNATVAGPPANVQGALLIRQALPARARMRAATPVRIGTRT